jgi:type IV pilus assembly protein PilY1
VGLKTADKNEVPIVNPLSGFVTPCAESFWSTADTYWPKGYQGNCVGANERSNLPDGEIVEKGGAAQKLRALAGESARTVKTCNSAACGALADFNTGNTAITKTLLGNPSMSDADRTALVNWARGQNVDGEALGVGDDKIIYPTSGIRPSAHGDVVHSRPLAVDYGGDIGVVVFYGGNEGMLRAINGNQTASIGSVPAGGEIWSFVAFEHYGKFDRLRSNTTAVSFPDLVVGDDDPTPQPKDYFFDGPISVYSSGGSKWIYATMRRGGSAVYAFDVSNPASPALKWKRDGTDLTNIGQTWSEPKVAKVAGYAIPAIETTPAVPKPLIIMGGGYDTCEDLDAVPNTTCSSPKGNRVFVLDADTGVLKQTFTTERSVVADVTLRDSDGDGLVDIGYAVDTGANIYRINIGVNAPEDWTMTKIAALGCDTAAACSRKFLHAPEVVVTADYNAVLVGSGNRERPLLNNAATLVDNAFFMIKDDATVSSPDVIMTSTTTTTGALALVEFDPNLEPTTAQLDELALSTNKGWYLAFGTPHSDPDLDHDKEQVVTSAVVFAGVAYFSTHTPTAPTACGANLGKARGYAVEFLNASSRDVGSKYSNFAGGGLAPSPVAGIVEIISTDEDGSTSTAKVPFIIGGKPSDGNIGSGIGGALLEVLVSPVRSRVYWYVQQ